MKVATARAIPKRHARLDIESIPAAPPKGFTAHAAKARLDSLGTELFALQDAMWGSRLNALLIVLQGRDAAGKDGAIKNVAGYLNPRGVSVASFGVPTREEL